MARHTSETHYGGPSKTELAILSLLEKGMTGSEILAATDFSSSMINKARCLISEEGSIRQRRNIEQGSKRLGKAIDFVHGSQAFAAQYKRPRQIAATVKQFFAPKKPTPISASPRLFTERRPEAPSREPCPKCQTRGDLGCAHQTPFVAASPSKLPSPQRGEM